MSLDYEHITTIYEKRWKVEEMHKSLKQNALLGNSPTKMERTQCNHIFAAMLAFVKLERLKIKEQLNHFALKAKLHLKMAKAAFNELQSWPTLKPTISKTITPSNLHCLRWPSNCSAFMVCPSTVVKR